MIRHSSFFSLIIAVAATMTLASCHTSRRAAGDSRPPVEIGAIHPGKPGQSQQRIVDEALSWVGTPYKYAGETKGEGTDCSGMVMRVYETTTGNKLPRNSAKQAEFCLHIDNNDVESGDLIFFATGKDPERVSHVGIVVDNEHFVHASSSKGVVVSDIYSPYYQRTFRMFGRVPEVNKELANKELSNSNKELANKELANNNHERN